MTPLARLATWLSCIAGACALAWVATVWRVDAAMPPTPTRLQPSPPVPSAARVQPVAAVVAMPADVASSPAVPASEPLRRLPPDASRMQREIQFAAVSDQRGKAGAAARLIEQCMAVEQLRAQLDAGQVHPALVDRRRALAREEDLVACQAVDAMSRAQWVPLLRRSLAEGDKRAAYKLITALGRDFNPANESAAMASLRRDASDCDWPSLRQLYFLGKRHPGSVTSDEVGAVEQMERLTAVALGDKLKQLADAEADPGRKAAIDRDIAAIKLPPVVASPEAVRLAADVRTRCEAGP